MSVKEALKEIAMPTPAQSHPAPDPEDRLPAIEPEGTVMGDWQKARTDAVSAMFDAGPDESGIYQTTRLYLALDAAFHAALVRVVREDAEIPLDSEFADGPQGTVEGQIRRAILRHWGLKE